MTRISGLSSNVINELKLANQTGKVNINNLVKEIAKDGLVDDKEVALLEGLSSGDIEIEDKDNVFVVKKSNFDPSDLTIKALDITSKSSMTVRTEAFKKISTISELKRTLEADQRIAGNDKTIYNADNKFTYTTAGKILMQDAIQLEKSGFLDAEDKKFLHKMVSEARTINSFTPEDIKKLDAIIEKALVKLKGDNPPVITNDVLDSSMAAINDAFLAVKETGKGTNVEGGYMFPRMKKAMAELDNQYNLVDSERIKIQSQIQDIGKQIEEQKQLNPNDPEISNLQQKLDNINQKYQDITTRLLEITTAKAEVNKFSTSREATYNAAIDRTKNVQEINVNLLNPKDLNTSIASLKSLITKYQQSETTMNKEVRTAILNILNAELKILQTAQSGDKQALSKLICDCPKIFDENMTKIKSLSTSIDPGELKAISALNDNIKTLNTKSVMQMAPADTKQTTLTEIQSVNELSLYKPVKIEDTQIERWQYIFNEMLVDPNIALKDMKLDPDTKNKCIKLLNALQLLSEFQSGTYIDSDKKLANFDEKGFELLRLRKGEIQSTIDNLKQDPKVDKAFKEINDRIRLEATKFMFSNNPDAAKEYASYLLSPSFKPANQEELMKEIAKLAVLDPKLAQKVSDEIIQKDLMKNWQTISKQCDPQILESNLAAVILQYNKEGFKISGETAELIAKELKNSNLNDVEGVITNLKNKATQMGSKGGDEIRAFCKALEKNSEKFKNLASIAAISSLALLEMPKDFKSSIEFGGSIISGLGEVANLSSSVFNIKELSKLGGKIGAVGGMVTAVADIWTSVEEFKKGDMVGGIAKVTSAAAGITGALAATVFAGCSWAGPVGIIAAGVGIGAAVVYETCAESDSETYARERLEKLGVMGEADKTVNKVKHEQRAYTAAGGDNSGVPRNMAQSMNNTEKLHLINYYMQGATSDEQEQTITDIITDTYDSPINGPANFLDLMSKLDVTRLIDELETKQKTKILDLVLKSEIQLSKSPNKETAKKHSPANDVPVKLALDLLKTNEDKFDNIMSNYFGKGKSAEKDYGKFISALYNSADLHELDADTNLKLMKLVMDSNKREGKPIIDDRVIQIAKHLRIDDPNGLKEIVNTEFKTNATDKELAKLLNALDPGDPLVSPYAKTPPKSGVIEHINKLLDREADKKGLLYNITS